MRLLPCCSFNRTVSGGWGTADVGGSSTVLDTAADWSVAPGIGSIAVPAGGQQRAVLGSVSVQNVNLLAKIVLPRCTGSGANCDAFLLGRVSGGSSPMYYRVGVVQGQVDMSMRRRCRGASRVVGRPISVRRRRPGAGRRTGSPAPVRLLRSRSQGRRARGRCCSWAGTSATSVADRFGYVRVPNRARDSDASQGVGGCPSWGRSAGRSADARSSSAPRALPQRFHRQ
jgi:hypothetical protein